MTGRHGRVNPSEVTTQIAALEPGLRPGWQWPATDPPDALAVDDDDGANATDVTIEFHRPPLDVDQLQIVLDRLRAL